MIESHKADITKSIDFVASSLDGIMKSTPSGLELVSTIANIGIFRFLASATAICSFLTSTMKIAAGSLFISEILPKILSILSLCLVSCNRSLLDKCIAVPSFIILSIDVIFLMVFLVVLKLVSIPPGHLSVTKGIFTSETLEDIISLACFFVATNRIFLPDLAI